MYEDKRTILPTGLLSQASQPNYTPGPIKMSFAQSGKPAPDHVNVDKDKEWQRNYQMEQLELQKKALKLQRLSAASGGGGGGMSVICTRYHELGFLPYIIYWADSRFGRRLLLENPDLMFWYWSWARPFVRHFLHGETLSSQLAIVAFWPLCKAWAIEVAHRENASLRGSWVGKLMVNTVMWAFKATKHTQAHV